MQRRTYTTLQFAAVVSIVGLGVFAWTGCDRSGESEATSQTPQQESSSEKSGSSEASPSEGGSEKKGAPSAGDDAPNEASGSASPPTGGADKKGMESGSAEVTDDELEEFAAVNEKLRPKIKEVKSKMKTAKGRMKKKKVQMELMRATQKAVQDSNLDTRRFSEIAKQLKKDPKLQKRLRSVADGSGDSDTGG